MSSIQTIIIDDDPVFRNILQKYLHRIEGVSVLRSCEDPVEATNIMGKQEPDLIFVDVEMPDLNGFEFIEALPTNPYTIMTTSYKKYAVEAFEAEVDDYLVKPLRFPRLLQAVNKVKNQCESNGNGANSSHIFVKVGSRLTKLRVDDIQYVEAEGDYVSIYTPDDSYLVHSTMQQVESQLPEQQFIRVHRSYIVKVSSIQALEKNILVLPDQRIPVSRSYKKNLLTQVKFLG